MGDAKAHSREDIEAIRRLIAVDEAEAKPHLADRLKIQKAWAATVDARDAEIERLRSALHDAEAIGDFAVELRDRLALKENAAAFEKMANEAIAVGQTLAAQRDEWEAKHGRLREAAGEAKKSIDELGARVSGVLRGVRLCPPMQSKIVGGWATFEAHVDLELERGRAALASLESALSAGGSTKGEV